MSDDLIRHAEMLESVAGGALRLAKAYRGEAQDMTGVGMWRILCNQFEMAMGVRCVSEAQYAALLCHDELLATLKAIVAAWESIPERDMVNEEMNLDHLWDNARAAIERAESEI